MVGEKDAGINSRYIGLFSDKLKNESSKVKVVKEAGHLLFKSHEDKFYKNVYKFFPNRNEIVKNEEPKQAAKFKY